MKTALIAAGLLFGGLVFAQADFGQIYAEAGKAAKAKDFAAAEAKYGEALTAARDSKQKCQAVLGKFQAMRGQKKKLAAEKFALDAVENERIDPPQIREILNAVAYPMIWDGRQEQARDLLQQARSCECPNDSNTFFATFSYLATIHLNKKEPQEAIAVLTNVTQVRNQHDANHFAAHMKIAQAYEQLGKKDEALRHYRLALEHGKKVKYKFDCSPAEKAIGRMSR